MSKLRSSAYDSSAIQLTANASELSGAMGTEQAHLT